MNRLNRVLNKGTDASEHTLDIVALGAETGAIWMTGLRDRTKRNVEAAAEADTLEHGLDMAKRMRAYERDLAAFEASEPSTSK